ncbi:MAG: hypothetical protein ABOK23_03105 [Candidatus Methanoperedens sp.]|nr:hypothetical protein [Candidatus Methanoperedens sp.]
MSGEDGGAGSITCGRLISLSDSLTADERKERRARWNINNELNTNSYELRAKYFKLSGAPIGIRGRLCVSKSRTADERR